MARSACLLSLLITLSFTFTAHWTALEPANATHKCTYKNVAYTKNGKAVTKLVEHCPAHLEGTTNASASSTHVEDEPTCEELLTEHLELLGVDTGDSDYQCGFTVYPEGEDELEITPGSVLTAMKAFEIPAPELVIQPPDGRTLVNFETNFYTEADVIHRSTTLLGQDIDFRIFPDSYTWHFGDGEAVTTASPGAPYPELDVTHKYLKKGTYQPSLETTYTADYRVNGGAWQPVPGSLVLTDEPQQLEAVTARPILVAPDGGTTR